MTSLFALFGGMAIGSWITWRIHAHMLSRLRRHHRMDRETQERQNQRETIESGRDTVARRSDYVVTEGDLLGTRPGVMTKDHLQDMERFSAKPVDLQPDWTTLSKSGSDSDQAI